MKAQRRTAFGFVHRPVFEFSHRRPKNLLRVAHNATGVWILAARDNLSARDKTCFVHYLAEEGFIPDRYSEYRAEVEEPRLGVQWLVEEPYSSGGAKMVIARLLGFGFLLWILQIAVILLARR